MLTICSALLHCEIVSREDARRLLCRSNNRLSYAAQLTNLSRDASGVKLGRDYIRASFILSRFVFQVANISLYSWQATSNKLSYELS